METNIAMYKLSKLLSEEIWNEYDHDDMKRLADRIRDNLDQNTMTSDLPNEFLTSWASFMEKYGFDGEDQLFISCPRYDDSPEQLLMKLKMNALGNVKDPAITQEEQVKKRRDVMAKHEKDAENASKFFHPFALSKVKKRNAILEHVIWIRNAPKLHLTKVIGMVRAEVLRVQDHLIETGRLKTKGDIFHLNIDEVDKAILEDPDLDLMEIIRPRREIYERAVCAKECPIIVDSRCRILKPDPPTFANGEKPEEGTFIGAAVSPGIAEGKVRIINNPSERFENGEILAAIVTGPSWTPLFASASAVILQVGGVLQHGALCAREYGKPAVSKIDIHVVLKDGMRVSVDGNTGIVKILEE